MPYSTNAYRIPKRQYNKTRLAIVACMNVGLVLFLFGLDLVEYRLPLFAASIAVLWTGAVLAYRSYQEAQGRNLELMARFTWFIALVEAGVLTVLSVSTLL